jgi:hypothetical protein
MTKRKKKKKWRNTNPTNSAFKITIEKTNIIIIYVWHCTGSITTIEGSRIPLANGYPSCG